MITKYYLYKEQPTYEENSELDIKYLQLNEIKYIESLIPGFGFWDAANRIFNGDRCLTLRKGNDIIGFIWVNFRVAEYKGTRFSLKSNEAYLYTAWTFEDYRGNGYAGILRRKAYKLLKSQGRDTFYSFTDCDNKSAVRYKEKLQARKLRKIMFVKLWKLKFTITLKNYDTL